MYAKPMQVGDSARTVLRLGCYVLGFAGLAGVWETLASQAPGSPLYIGVLPGPVESLREIALELGGLLLLAGMLLGERALPKRTLWLIGVGLLLTLVSATYAAAVGMHAVQVRDLRPEAIWLFLAKFLGRGLVCAGLVEIAVRALGQSRSA
jgi:hypothetical protein